MTSERLREIARIIAEFPSELLVATEERAYMAAVRDLSRLAEEFDKVVRPGTELPAEPPLFYINNPDEGRLWALERNAEIVHDRLVKLEAQIELAAHGVEPKSLADVIIDANRYALTKKREGG